MVHTGAFILKYEVRDLQRSLRVKKLEEGVI